MTAEKEIQQLRDLIAACKPGRMVFFGGAGVSTESGIPDFRSPDGLYAQKYGDISPETMISRSYFDACPQKFFEFYFDRMIAREAMPNKAHVKLAQLEEEGTLSAVVTQNIDGLQDCGRAYDLDQEIALHEAASDGIPRCESCGAIVKPDVVLYEEGLDGRILEASINAIRRADLLVIAGTSLAVYPAAGLIDYFSGDNLVIINLAPTPRDRFANLCVAAKVGEVLGY